MIYLWKCKVCGQETEIERPVAECTVPPEGPCPPWSEEHTSDWQRVYQAAMITKESYPDGYKRKGFRELKEAAKLERVAAVTKDSGTKAEIRKEIQRMGIKPSKPTNM